MKLKLTISLLTALSVTHFTVKPAAIEMRDVKEDQKALNDLFIRAAETGDTEIVKALLEKGANVDFKDTYGETALVKAAIWGHTTTAKVLLNAGANVNTSDNTDNTALSQAATITDTKTEEDSIEIVSALLQANAEIPKNISRFPEVIQALLKQERQARNSLTTKDGAGGDQTALKIMQDTTKSASETEKAKEDQKTLNDQLLDSNIYVNDIWAYYENPDNNYNSPDKRTEKVKALLKQGADVNAQSNYGYTALMMAAKNDRTEIMKFLLDKGADVNTADKYNGDTALMMAADEGNAEAVLILLDNKADVNASNKYGHTALTRATDKGYLRIILILLNKGVKDNTAERYNERQLIKSASVGYTIAVKFFLDENTDINATDKFGNTALMRAAEAGHTEIVNFLLDKGANVNAINQDGETALMKAAEAGHTEVVNFLLDKGANVNAINRYGETAFAGSIHSRNIEMILVLFDKTDINPTQLDKALLEASISIKSEELCTKIAQILLDKAADLGIDLFSSPMQCLNHPNSTIANLLLDRGLDINFINQWKRTVLMHAAMYGSTEYVNTLLDRGASINITDNDGKTALMKATDNTGTTTRANNILALLERGASINITDNNGETALMEAASSGFTEAVNLLLDRGADVNITSKDNETALMKAAHEGYTEIVEGLLNKGANIDIDSANKDNDTALILAARPALEKKPWENKKTLEDSISTVNALLQANAEIPEDISEFPEAIQAILEQERQTRRSRIKSAAKKGNSFPTKASREDGAGKA